MRYLKPFFIFIKQMGNRSSQVVNSNYIDSIIKEHATWWEKENEKFEMMDERRRIQTEKYQLMNTIFSMTINDLYETYGEPNTVTLQTE